MRCAKPRFKWVYPRSPSVKRLALRNGRAPATGAWRAVLATARMESNTRTPAQRDHAWCDADAAMRGGWRVDRDTGGRLSAPAKALVPRRTSQGDHEQSGWSAQVLTLRPQPRGSSSRPWSQISRGAHRTQSPIQSLWSLKATAAFVSGQIFRPTAGLLGDAGQITSPQPRRGSEMSHKTTYQGGSRVRCDSTATIRSFGEL